MQSFPFQHATSHILPEVPGMAGLPKWYLMVLYQSTKGIMFPVWVNHTSQNSRPGNDNDWGRHWDIKRSKFPFVYLFVLDG